MSASLSLLLFVVTAGAVDNLQAVTDDYRRLQDLPGISVLLVRDEREVFAGGSGFADLESERRMTADTPLYAGSLSKIFTAVLTLNLVAGQRLSLDEAVAGIGAGDSGITITHLLTHSSGLPREGNFGYWFSGEFPDRSALSRFLAVSSPRSPPGQTVNYSNIGFAALGLELERASGESYMHALSTRVLRPLQLESTGGPGPVPGIASGYTPPGRLLPREDRPFAGVGRQVGTRHVREYHDAAAMTPAFGLYTTASDLGRLARFLLGSGDNGILPDELRRQMLKPANASRTLGLGTGVFDGREVVRHSGWFAAHRSYVIIDPETGSAAIVLANSDNADPEAIAEALLREMTEADAALAPASK
jgi:CubicO group peptidase (beta-lactamase class C family)